jgi:hypothetical protein
MSNFVVAKGVERLDKDGVERVVAECKAVQGGRGMISEFTANSRACGQVDRC